jgi:hypothetical protein
LSIIDDIVVIALFASHSFLSTIHKETPYPMKSASQAKAGRREMEINLLAHDAVSKNYSRARVLREINGICAGKKKNDKEDILVRVMRRCYETAGIVQEKARPGSVKRMLFKEGEHLSEEKLHECFAVRLCSFLIEKIQGMEVACTSDYRFSGEFYAFCVQELSSKGFAAEIADTELMEIYIKQALIILRHSGILVIENGRARISDKVFSGSSLFMQILSSFWNVVKWEDIFPSNTAAARDLKKSRHILIDVLLKYQSTFSIDEASNNFFDLTGFARTNDLYIISFLDFYFFTWMKHFGLVIYEDTASIDQVKIRLSERGRKLFKGLQSLH